MSEAVKTLQEKVREQQRNKTIIKEKQDENRMLEAEIQDLLELIQEAEGKDEVEITLQTGDEVVVKRSYSTRHVLDKDGLANTIGVDKSDLKAPFDYSILTKQGKLDPKQITDHMYDKSSTKVKISKKKKPKKSRQK